jgi:hypothetical protein
MVAVPSLLFMGLIAQVLSLQLDTPTSVLFFQISMAIVGLFAWVYYEIARDIKVNRPYILLGVIAKSIFVVIILAHYFLGNIQWPLALLVVVDIAYAFLFLRVYERTK